MSILTHLDDLLSGRHEKNIAPLALAALGFAASGGIEGIVGGGKRREEEASAKREQAQQESDYKNFDFTQDVGGIRNIYSDYAQQSEEYLTDQTNQASANQLQALQQRQGGFGASQALLQQRTQAARANEQRIGQIRQAGVQYAEQQRQSILNKRYDRTQTLLARSEHRLAAAKRARQKATENIFKGIGGGLSAGLGAASAGKGASFSDQLKASGLVQNTPEQTSGPADFNQFLKTKFDGINYNQ